MEKWTKGGVVKICKSLDLHELYLGEEVGTGGFQHYQYCVDCAGDLEQYAENNNLGWHVERCISWELSVEYCRKENKYHYFGDSIEERTYRTIQHRTLNDFQKIIDYESRRSDLRIITVFIDRDGCGGKSSILYNKVRNGEWLAIPRTEQQPNRMNDYVCAYYKNESTVVLDLARAKVLQPEQTEVLEDIKDGLVQSTKYEGKKRFMKGVNVIVFTNQWIPKKTYEMLTEDRWNIWIRKDGAIYQRERGYKETEE